jgi:hypothetical protein
LTNNQQRQLCKSRAEENWFSSLSLIYESRYVKRQNINALLSLCFQAWAMPKGNTLIKVILDVKTFKNNFALFIKMRIWSIHPKYLDTKGLVALWRETLLARHVLQGKTKGYQNHPQLYRFKQTDKPVDRINQYLAAVYNEALKRNYNFDKDKIDWNFEPSIMYVTIGQIEYESRHLLGKLKTRDRDKYDRLKNLKKVDQHPIFKIIKGEIENWEKV